MPTIAAGGQAAVSIPVGYKLSIQAGGTGTIYASPGGTDAIPAGQAIPYGPSAFALGPFTVADQVMVYAATATTYSVDNAAAGSLNADQAAQVQALVSGAGNQPSATLRATTGTPGQVVRLSDGPDAGALLVWAQPAGSSTYTWCWWLWPQSAY